MKLHENYPLKDITTFHAKVYAKDYTEFSSATELKEILSSSIIKSKPFMILGGGSNVLFTGDYNGVIIRNAIKGIEIVKEEANDVYIKANGGEKWHDFVMYCVGRNYGGGEKILLLPGTVW